MRIENHIIRLSKYETLVQSQFLDHFFFMLIGLETKQIRHVKRVILLSLTHNHTHLLLGTSHYTIYVCLCFHVEFDL